MVLLLSILLGSMIVVILVQAASQVMSRSNIIFGVALPMQYAKAQEIKKWRKQYVWATIIGGIVMVLPLIFLLIGQKSEEALVNIVTIYFLVLFLVYLLYSLAVFLFFRKKVLAFKGTHNLSSEENGVVTVSTDFRKKPVIISNSWLIWISLLIILITVMVTFTNYHQIPETIPTHWGPSGAADGFSQKSVGGLLMVPVLQLVMLIIMAVSNFGLKNMKQKLNSDAPKAAIIQNQRYRMANSKMLVIMGILIELLFMYMQFMMIFAQKETSWLFFVLIGLVVVVGIGGSLYIGFRYGQGGVRYQVSEHELEATTKETYTEDDNNWKLGLIYYNPKDPALWVEKRFGLGITLNFGNRRAWWFVAGFIILMILIIVLPLTLI